MNNRSTLVSVNARIKLQHSGFKKPVATVETVWESAADGSALVSVNIRLNLQHSVFETPVATVGTVWDSASWTAQVTIVTADLEQVIYSLKRRRFTGRGIPIMNLRPTNYRLSFIVGTLIPIKRCLRSEQRSRGGVTKPIFSFPLFSQFFGMMKTMITWMISSSHLTGVTTAELRRHLANMNMIESF